MDQHMIKMDVIKLNHLGQETWRYSGEVLKQTPSLLVLEAFFDREKTLVGDLVLMRGDRFIEYYYNDRWYNIFEIQDLTNHNIKGWYCNISYPAIFSTRYVTYQDLALDLLVYPTGQQVVLDEDEFETLPLSPFDRKKARQSLNELQQIFQDGQIIQGGWDG
jgi:hypothetical protein